MANEIVYFQQAHLFFIVVPYITVIRSICSLQIILIGIGFNFILKFLKLHSI